MIWFLKTAKALMLTAQLQAGEPTLCPNQVEGWDDEELNCKVLAVLPTVDLVIVGEGT